MLLDFNLQLPYKRTLPYLFSWEFSKNFQKNFLKKATGQFFLQVASENIMKNSSSENIVEK